jgi:hypothetical protein
VAKSRSRGSGKRKATAARASKKARQVRKKKAVKRPIGRRSKKKPSRVNDRKSIEQVELNDIADEFDEPPETDDLALCQETPAICQELTTASPSKVS